MKNQKVNKHLVGVIIMLTMGLAFNSLADESNKATYSGTKNYVFQCDFFFQDTSLSIPATAYGGFNTFRVDTSGLPDKQICGESEKKCRDAGFEGHIEEDEVGNYINYPTLIAKQCVKIEFAPQGRFIEVKIGVVPHLDRAGISIKEGGGDREDFLKTEAGSIVNGVEKVYAKYEDSEKFYLVKCDVFHEDRVTLIGEGKDDLLSLSQPINTCI